MAEIAGVLQYDLTADMKGLDKGLDEAESKVKKSGSSMAAGFSKAVVGGTLIAGAAAVAFGAKAYAAYNEAEKASVMLEHAVVKVSGATQEQLKATSALADELERKGVLDGDNIKQGLAQLSTFGLSNAAVQGLGKSMADLAVNQTGVNSTGKDLEGSANLISKALRGQFSELQKTGIIFTDAQKQMIQFGTEQEKVTAINEGFARNLKYTNEVALTTAEGKLAAAKVQMGNFQEAIGQAISEGITPLVGAFNSWIEKQGGVTAILEKTTNFVKDNMLWLQILAGFVATTLVLAFGLWAVSVIAATWPILLAAAAIVGLIVGIKTLIDNWDRVRQAFLAAGAWIGGVIDKFYGMLGPIGLVIKSFKELGENWDKVKNVGSGGLSKITGFFGGARAEGGPISKGQTYLTGERGPELITASKNGYVHDAESTAAMAGGATYVFNVGSVDSESRVRQLANAVEEMIGRKQQYMQQGAA